MRTSCACFLLRQTVIQCAKGVGWLMRGSRPKDSPSNSIPAFSAIVGMTGQSHAKWFAQFIAICSSVKMCEIGENLLFVSDSRLGSQGRLIDVDALIHSPSLQHQPVSSLHPCVAVERSVAPVSPLPESGRRSLGDVPLSPRV